MKKLMTLSILTVMLVSAMLFLNSCSEKKEIESDDLGLELYNGNNIDEEAVIGEVFKSESSDLKCAGFYEICGALKFYPLIASKHYYVGTLLVYNDDENLYVTYWTGWWRRLTDFHLYVGTEEDLPLTATGNPKFGQFPYSDEESIIGIKTFVIPLSEIPECPVIVAHAVLCDHTVLAYSGRPFDGSRWGWIIDDFCVEPCEEEKEIVTALKIYLGDPSLGGVVPAWWAMNRGEGAENNISGMGINRYIYNEENIYPLYKMANPDDIVGTITVTDYWENQVHYLEVVIDTYEDRWFFYNSYLYAGSEAGYYDNYVYVDEDGINHSEWRLFPFQQFDESDIRIFKIPFDDIVD